ncbi:dipeptide transport system permease DppC [Klebsiella pneumoniae]|uniref:Dipeptide transport system permease DppC n=1 Tax=Klebsiella pneumoniae TaxID=573 RepID=A0A377U516_KLEPN|nr:dipeptide transport system permease DppC [Klebsiella pneumoniae]
MSQVTENKVIAAPVPMTPLQEFWHYFKRNKGAVVGLVYVVVMIVIAVFANFLAPYNPADQFRDSLLAPPFWQDGGSMAHLLGTDDVGRDILSRLMYGARLSLLVGCLVVVLSLILGVVLGLVAGYFGGVVDSIIMRVVDIMLALPSLLLALVLGGNLRALHRQRLAGANLRGAPRTMCVSRAPRCWWRSTVTT